MYITTAANYQIYLIAYELQTNPLDTNLNKRFILQPRSLSSAKNSIQTEAIAPAPQTGLEQINW